MIFYVCETCGNFVGMINESGAPMSCCGKHMKELVPGTSDGAVEKHVQYLHLQMMILLRQYMLIAIYMVYGKLNSIGFLRAC